jgi:hypothetical protein
MGKKKNRKKKFNFSDALDAKEKVLDELVDDVDSSRIIQGADGFMYQTRVLTGIESGISGNNYTKVESCLIQGSDANVIFPSGSSPLTCAMYCGGDADIISLLLSYNANPSMRDGNNKYPFVLANGKPHIIRMMKKQAEFQATSSELTQLTATNKKLKMDLANKRMQLASLHCVQAKHKVELKKSQEQHEQVLLKCSLEYTTLREQHEQVLLKCSLDYNTHREQHERALLKYSLEYKTLREQHGHACELINKQKGALEELSVQSMQMEELNVQSEQMKAYYSMELEKCRAQSVQMEAEHHVELDNCREQSAVYLVSGDNLAALMEIDLKRLDESVRAECERRHEQQALELHAERQAREDILEKMQCPICMDADIDMVNLASSNISFYLRQYIYQPYNLSFRSFNVGTRPASYAVTV